MIKKMSGRRKDKGDGMFGRWLKAILVLLFCYHTTRALSTTQQSVTETVHPCATYGCINGGEYFWDYIDDICKCNCTAGFAGLICNESAVVGLASTIAADPDVNIQDAEFYASEARTIIYDQIDQGYQKLASSATASTSVGATLVTKADEAAKKGDNLTTLTSELTGMTASVFSVTTGCATETVTGCTLNDDETQSIVEKTEENLGNMIHLMLNTQKKSKTPVPINRDNISITVLKAKGKDMPSEYSTAYGSLTLPYWETFQGEQRGKDVLLSLISYQDSPYTYSPNKDDVTSSVVKINATDKNGRELSLNDPDDPITLSIDTTSAFADETTWKDMDEFKSVEGAFMLVAAFNYTVNAIIIEIRIKTLKVCTIYGKYGHFEPSEEDNDINIKTKGLNEIQQVDPDTLNIDFQSQVFRLTLINPNASEVMDPLVLTILCEDYKLGSFGLPIHEYRIADVDLRYYNKELRTWNKSLDMTLAASKGKSVGFKSTFFGTFSANVLFIPPEPIDFVSIFLNFSERLKQTPHSLAASVGLIVIFLFLSIPLGRLDRKDSLLWSYLPLIDDKHVAGFIYEIAVFTDVRSPKRFTAKPYFSLKGEDGETGTRVLLDGIRQNFGRGSSSHFTMRSMSSLGKIKELRIWHDNSGASPSWLLSRIVINDKQTGERYVFICGDWLSEKHSDGQTWRSLFPAEPDELDGNVMLNEMSKNHLFEDHLWLSVSMRPHFSRFSRVQRLWTIVCLLFLSMIASAMWYNTTDPTGGSTISLGPLKLNYKTVYVGFMAALIAAVPSLIIMLIFKNRRLKGEGKYDNKIKDSSKIDQTLPTEIKNDTEGGGNAQEKNPEANLDPCHSSLNAKTFDEGFGSMADDDEKSNYDLVSEYSAVVRSIEANTLGVQGGLPNTSTETETGGFQKLKPTNLTPVTIDFTNNNLQNNYQEDDQCVISYNGNHKYFEILDSIQSSVSGVKDGTTNLKLDYKAGGSEFNDMNNINSQTTSEYRISQSTIDIHYSKSVPVLDSNPALTREVWNKTEPGIVKEQPKRIKQRGPCLLPWGFIFIGYFLVLACVGSSTFFTFMYTLEWGPDKTVEWMTAFLFGTLQSVLVIEPIKAIFLALVFVCFCKRSAVGKLAFIGKPNEDSFETPQTKSALTDVKEQKEQEEGDENNEDENNGDAKSVVQVEDVCLFDYPGGKEEDARVLAYKRKVQLDRRLAEKFRLLVGQCLYITILAIICSHNIVTTSYYQNTDISNRLNASYQPNNSDDIWNWLEGHFVNTTFPKWYYNEQVREAYIQRYLENTYNMRLGFARVRQVRVKGSCDVLHPMSDVVSICPNVYSEESEETGDFCVDWVPYNESCFDENEETDYSFQYKSEDKSKAIPYIGTFAIYGGGGYYVDLGPKQSLVLTYLQRLRTDNWIDNYTRAVFADVVTFNPNLRIFNHLKVVFEKPVMGGIFMTTDIWSANLYPYISSWDYVVLGFQILFVIILFVRIVLFLVSICHLRTKCCTTIGMWVRLLEILLAIGAIVAFAIRIDKTISAIETVFNNFGKYTSFEIIHVLDVIYKTLISSVLFIAILELLKPLSFNYYIYLMRTSIYISRKELFGMFIMVFIPMFAFAALFYLFIGHTQKDYRDIPNSLFSLMLILIGMVDLSDKNEFGDIFIYLVYGTYTIVMTIIIISVFISILSIAFNIVRSQKDLEKDNTFDAELSEHLINKVTSAFAKLVISKPVKNQALEAQEKDNHIVDTLMEKVKEVETFAKERNKEEIKYHRKLAYGMFGMMPKDQKLACLISFQADCTVLTYTNKENNVLLKLFIKDISWNKKIEVKEDKNKSVNVKDNNFDVSRENRTPIFKLNGGSDMVNTPITLDVYDILNMSSTNSTRSTIFVNFGKNWEKCNTEIVYPSSNENQIKFRTILQQCPKEIVVLRSNSHEVNTQPEQEQQQQTLVPEEKFEIQSDGGTYTSSVNAKISITVDPETVVEDCTLTVIVKPFGLSPLLELTLSEDVKKPLRVTLPCTGTLDQNSSETIALIREKDEEWMKLNVVLEVENGTFKFRIPKANLKKDHPTTIIVKQSEIGWVDRSANNKKALFDDNTIRTIASNLTIRPSKLAEYLKCQITKDPFKVHNGQNHIINEQILRTWVNESELDDYEKMKKLEDILIPLGLTDLAQWLKDDEFKLRCSSASNYESVQLIKAINMVARFEMVAKQWQSLAETLEVDEKFIHKIDTDIPRCCEEKLGLVLFQWFKESKSKTVADLSKIMKDRGFKKVAGGLQKM